MALCAFDQPRPLRQRGLDTLTAHRFCSVATEDRTRREFGEPGPPVLARRRVGPGLAVWLRGSRPRRRAVRVGAPQFAGHSVRRPAVDNGEVEHHVHGPLGGAVSGHREHCVREPVKRKGNAGEGRHGRRTGPGRGRGRGQVDNGNVPMLRRPRGDRATAVNGDPAAQGRFRRHQLQPGPFQAGQLQIGDAKQLVHLTWRAVTPVGSPTPRSRTPAARPGARRGRRPGRRPRHAAAR